MQDHPRFLAILLAAALLSGCGSAPILTSGMLTYRTQPEGAVLYEGGQAIGTAPVTRTYPSDGKSSTIRTPDVTAVWPSGAKETYYTLMPVGADLVATIERPKSAPGLQVDLDNAKKFAAAREAEERRLKEEAAREIRRNSDRCKAQQSGTGGIARALSDDCM